MIELTFFEDLQFNKDIHKPNIYKKVHVHVHVQAKVQCVIQGLIGFGISPNPFSSVSKMYEIDEKNLFYLEDQ